MLQVIITLILAVAQPSDNLYYSGDGSFSVLEPSAFTEKYQEMTTDIGNIEVYTLLSQPDSKEHPNFLYLINYYDYPDGMQDQDSVSTDEFVKKIFDESIDQSLASLDGKLLYSSNITLQESYDGRINRISYNEGDSMVKSKMFLVDNRFYFLQVYTTKNNSLNLFMDEFLDSFKILK